MLDPKAVRRTILGMLHRAQAGHLGSAMSTVEMLIAMYSSVDIDKIKRKDPDRARIVVSKGHCAAAHYAVLHHFGILSSEELATYYKSGSKLVGLCSHEVPGVEHSTGSLGHGLSVAAGMAVALRNRGSASPVFCLLGDGELQEGSNWEAFALIRHLKLRNVITLIDDNGIGMIDRTKDVQDMTPLTDAFRGFGFAAVSMDGHDADSLVKTIRLARKHWEYPAVIICRTKKGKGVPFAEDVVLWHYRTLTDETYKQAVEAL